MYIYIHVYMYIYIYKYTQRMQKNISLQGVVQIYQNMYGENLTNIIRGESSAPSYTQALEYSESDACRFLKSLSHTPACT